MCARDLAVTRRRDQRPARLGVAGKVMGILPVLATLGLVPGQARVHALFDHGFTRRLWWSRLWGSRRWRRGQFNFGVRAAVLI